MDKVNTSQYAFLVENNKKLVYKIARRFKTNPFDFDDLVQAGLMGLYRAACRFDITKGVKFSTYATHFIIGAIKDELSKKSLIKNYNYMNSLENLQNKDATDKIIYENYGSVILKEDLNDIEGNYLNIDNFDFDSLEKKILKLRLINHATQMEIAKELSLSQSKVSRILKRMREKVDITKWTCNYLQVFLYIIGNPTNNNTKGEGYG